MNGDEKGRGSSEAGRAPVLNIAQPHHNRGSTDGVANPRQVTPTSATVHGRGGCKLDDGRAWVASACAWPQGASATTPREGGTSARAQPLQAAVTYRASTVAAAQPVRQRCARTQVRPESVVDRQLDSEERAAGGAPHSRPVPPGVVCLHCGSVGMRLQSCSSPTQLIQESKGASVAAS